MNYIYTLSSSENPEIVKYVGYTNNPTRRLNKHNHSFKHDTNKRTCWIESVQRKGYEIIMNIIDEKEDFDEIKLLERSYIKFFKSVGAKLKNATEGGEGTKGFKHTDESKKKISEASKRRVYVKKEKPIKTKHTRFITEDKKEEVENLYKKGINKKTISSILNISESSTHNILINLGYAPIKLKTEINKEILEEFYIKDNLTKKEISEITGISERMIKKRLKDFGIKKEADKITEVQNRIKANKNG